MDIVCMHQVNGINSLVFIRRSIGGVGNNQLVSTGNQLATVNHSNAAVA